MLSTDERRTVRFWRPDTHAVAGMLRVEREDRMQVTYAERPLYYYVGDRRARQILCQNVTEFGGVWRVIRPTGTLVR